MRLLGHLLLFLLLALGCYWVVENVVILLPDANEDREKERLSALASKYTLFTLENKNWLTFKLLPETTFLRLVTTASLHHQPVPLLPDQDWGYSMAYRIFDDNDNVLQEGVWHFRSQISRYLDPVSKLWRTASFFLDSNYVPLVSRVTLVNLHSLPQARRLDVKRMEWDGEITEVGLRGLFPQIQPDYRLGYLWRRLTPETRQKLATGNVYPVDFLDEKEIQHLLATAWRPMAPEGVAQKTFTTREIYTLLGEETGQKEPPPILPAGVLTGDGLAATQPLPEQGGKITLRFTPVDDKTKKNETATILWRGRGLGNRQTFSLPLNNQSQSFTHTLTGGILEMVAREKYTVRTFLEQAGQQKEITALPRLSRIYLLTPDRPLTATIRHVGNIPTPLRLELRHLYKTFPAQPHQIQLQLLDQQGLLVSQHALLPTPMPSLYDRPTDINLDLKISDPNYFYFNIPAGVTTLRITAADQVAAAFWNRPGDRPLTIREPEDAFPDPQIPGGQPAWLPLWPDNHDALLLENRSLTLSLGHRPTEEDPLIAAGLFASEELRPNGSWLGRNLLFPWQEGTPLRPEALPVLFHPIATDRENSFQWVAQPGEALIRPRLVWIRPEEKEKRLSLHLDGKLLQEKTIAGRRGSWDLPPVSRGWHRLTLQGAPAGTFFINRVVPQEGDYLEKVAYLLPPQGLIFSLDHPGGEATLGVRHIAFQKKDRSRLRVEINGTPTGQPGPFEDWTFRHHVYDLRLDPGGETLSLQGGPQIGSTCQLFIKLGRDLLPGRYTVNVVPEGGSGGYITLSRLISGLVDNSFIQIDTPLLEKKP